MKKKMNKKLFARICAVLACVLLVGALVVPCFADDIETQVDDAAIYEGFTFTILNNDKVMVLEEFYANMGAALFDYSYFNGGCVTPSFWYSCRYNGNVQSREIVSDIYLVMLVDGENPIFETSEPLVARCCVYFDYTIAADDGEASLLVTFVRTDVISGEIACQLYYEGDLSQDLDGRYLSELFLSSISSKYFSTITDFENTRFTFGILGMYYSEGIGSGYQSLSLFNSLFDSLNALAASNPLQFYQGSTSVAYQLGITAGFNSGYDSGREYGFSQGWQEGYNDGVKDTIDVDQYLRGYNDAVSEIDSGDFGRNFLGGLLNAPLDALNNLVLVEYTIQEGKAPLKVTLGGVLYLAIAISLSFWLLKMARG